MNTSLPLMNKPVFYTLVQAVVKKSHNTLLHSGISSVIPKYLLCVLRSVFHVISVNQGTRANKIDLNSLC